MSENTNNQAQGFLRVKQIAKLLGIGKSTFYKWVKEGKFSEGIKFGERIRVWKTEEIYNFIENAGTNNEAYLSHFARNNKELPNGKDSI